MRTIPAIELLTVTRPDFYALRVGTTITVPANYGEVTGAVESWRVDEREDPIYRNGYEVSGYRAKVVGCEFKIQGHGWVVALPETLIAVHD
jgi:hypothetical protein